MKHLKKEYETIVDKYLKVFCEKQDLEIDYWVGDKVGEIVFFTADYFFNFTDILIDIDSDCKKGLILEWYNDSVDFDFKINYRSYIKGLRYSDVQMFG